VPEDVVVVSDLADALEAAAANAQVEKIFVIGGATVYKQALLLPECTHIYLTVVKHEFECDTVMPVVDVTSFPLDPSYTEHVVEGDVEYEYRLHTRTA
jgi:dihydrofolate reductase